MSPLPRTRVPLGKEKNAFTGEWRGLDHVPFKCAVTHGRHCSQPTLVAQQSSFADLLQGRAIDRLVGNIDLREGANFYFYHHPDDHWYYVPWDLDLMFIPTLMSSGTIDQKNCLLMRDRS